MNRFLASIFSAMVFTLASAAAPLVEFKIPAQSLEDSLRSVGKACNINILIDRQLTAGLHAPELQAQLTIEEALQRLLIGTSLTYAFVDDRTVTLQVRDAVVVPISNLSKSQDSGPVEVAEEPINTEAALEEVLVTGSRIESDASRSPSPVTSIGSEQVRQIGATSAADLFQRLPALRFSGTATSGVTNYSSFEVATPNLRDLGPERTLTLVNGRRHVSGVAGSAAVDIDTIPTALIERVEIVTGGAASIYGADAVTGVVNYILKKDFTGFSLEAFGGQLDQGLGREYAVNAAAGFNFGAQEQGNIVFSVDWKRISEVNQADTGVREAEQFSIEESPGLYVQSADITPALSAQGVRPGDFIPGLDESTQQLFPAARLQQGLSPQVLAYGRGVRFAFSGQAGSYGIDLDGDGFQDSLGADINNDGLGDCENTFFFYGGIEGGCWTRDPRTGDVRPLRDGVFFGNFRTAGGDFSDFPESANIFEPQLERLGLNLNAHYDFTDTTRGFIETKFSRAESRLFNQYYFTYLLPIRLDNPFVPDVLNDALDDYRNSNPSADLSSATWVTTRDNFDWGPQRADVDSSTARVVFGVEGSFSPSLTYELAFNLGRTEQNRRSLGFMADRLYAALDVVADPVTGQPVCRSSLDPNAIPFTNEFNASLFNLAEETTEFRYQTFQPGDGSCRPLNAFNGFAPQTVESLSFINQLITTNAILEQQVISAEVAGDAGERLALPGGLIRFAAGVEYRREVSRLNLSDNLLNGFVFQSAYDETRGTYNSKDVFAEVQAPILANRFLAQELTVTGSARVADFSTSGTATTWGMGFTWTPWHSTRLRGSLAKAVRAPNIGELFTPTQIGVASPIPDPCSENLLNQGPSPQNRARNCSAAGIDPGVEAIGELDQRSGGNPDLAPETAHTATIGLVLQPARLPSLLLSVDYYQIEIDDAISTPDIESVVNACYDASAFPNPFCEQFTRNASSAAFPFSINAAQVEALNFARFETRGVDVSLNYLWDLSRVGLTGNLDLGANINRVFNLDDFLLPDDPASVKDRLDDKYSAVTSISWSGAQLTVGVNSLYLARARGVDTETFTQINPFYGPLGTLSPAWVHDLSISYQLTDPVLLQFGINNITGQPSVYDSANFPRANPRRYFLSVSAKF
jgi:iron complex outermembrane recepter protein